MLDIVITVVYCCATAVTPALNTRSRPISNVTLEVNYNIVCVVQSIWVNTLVLSSLFRFYNKQKMPKSVFYKYSFQYPYLMFEPNHSATYD